MNERSIIKVLEIMTRVESRYEEIILNYSEKSGKKIISSPFFFIPPEINAAFNIITVKIPEFILNNSSYTNSLSSIYDAIIIPENEYFCSKNVHTDSSAYIFKTPAGFGEDAAVSLHNEISMMLKSLFNIDLKSINIETLQRETSIYEKLRRLIRTITSLRSENISLLSNSELSLIFETAVILPPEMAIEYISPVLDEMKKITSVRNSAKQTWIDHPSDQLQNSDIMSAPITNESHIRAMLYGGKSIPPAIADSIEKNGILIIEDDSCTGRRLFDISLNAESEYIFYEILDAYSYRPLTPCLRPVEERYELLYKLLKNYNIKTVLFFEDENCHRSVDDINYLRIRMMRDGIDPLVINKYNYLDVVKDYVRKL